MSDKSPLFVSSIESLSHAAELYLEGKERKYKFVILHLANAVELIIKDSLIDNGVSIYKNPKETINIWTAFSELKTLGITVLEKPIIELLFDDRNTIQHRFGFPNAGSVFYYLEQVATFFINFLKTHYSLDLEDVLKPLVSKEVIEILGLADNNEYSYLSKLMDLSAEAAIVHSFSLVEKKILKHISPYLSSEHISIQPSIWRHKTFWQLFDDLSNKGFLPEGIGERFSDLHEIRNIAAHLAIPHDKSDSVNWDEAFSTVKILISGLNKAEKEGYAFSPTEKTIEEDKEQK
jgi:hypothetical protein